MESEAEAYIDNNDVAPLVKDEPGSSKRWKSTKGVIGCILVFLSIFIVCSSIIIWYFSQYNNGLLGHTLKVMALNVWGVPATFGSLDKEERMKAIGEYIQRREYDVYLIEELWMRPDHATIKSMIPQGDQVSFTSPIEARKGNVRWLREVGDFVLKGDEVCVLEGRSDSVTLASEEDGVLSHKFVAEGEVVAPNKNLYNITVGGYVMTEVGQLATSFCDGRAAPDFCSGLAVVSRFPFKEIEFMGYSDHGDAFWNDGEYFARKGLGRVRIEPYRNLTVDLFLTHTCASDYNYYYRQRQVNELVSHLLKKRKDGTDADFTVLGGDFNVDPRMNETSFNSVKYIMVNAIEDYFHAIQEWLKPERATYANPSNTYSNGSSPVLYDYIFHKAKGKNLIWTDLFQIPFLKTLLGTSNNENKTVSFSDHEAVTSHLRLYKYNPVDWAKDS